MRRAVEPADLVLAPSQFIADTVQEFHRGKRVALASYGVDLAGWPNDPRNGEGAGGPLFVEDLSECGFIGCRIFCPNRTTSRTGVNIFLTC